MINSMRKAVSTVLSKLKLTSSASAYSSPLKNIHHSFYRQAFPYSIVKLQIALHNTTFFRNICKNMGLTNDLIEARISGADILIELGKYDESLHELADIMKQTGQVCRFRSAVHVNMAMAYFKLGKVDEAKKNLEIGGNVLEKLMVEKEEDYNDLFTARVYMDMGVQYGYAGGLNDFVVAANMYNRSLAIAEKLPREVARKHRWVLLLPKNIGEILRLFKGNEELAISYLKRGVKMMKEEIGDGDESLERDLMDMYLAVGLTYMEMGNYGKATNMLVKGKDIADASFGLDDVVARAVYFALAITYGSMERYLMAADLMREVVQMLETLELGADESCVMARQFLQEFDDLAHK